MCRMFPTIDLKETGKNLRKVMKERNITVKEVQHYLGLGSVQSVYHWLNGISMPSIDNLYALSVMFELSMDELVCGNKKECADTKDVEEEASEDYLFLNRASTKRVA